MANTVGLRLDWATEAILAAQGRARNYTSEDYLCAQDQAKEAYGPKAPALVDATNEILAGDGRLFGSDRFMGVFAILARLSRDLEDAAE